MSNITKVYQTGETEVHALRGVDLNVMSSEMVAVMGASGSGKSTLMNIIGCLDFPTTGRYILDNIDVSQLTHDQLSKIRCHKIGFVFQNYSLLPRTSALANVELPLVYAGITPRERHLRATEALEIVGLRERIDHNPSELSGGQQQRVAIARALINRPSLIVADEPTGNLDSKTSDDIMNLFRTLNQQQNITIILVTHDPEITQYCRRVIYFRDGLVERDNRLFDR